MWRVLDGERELAAAPAHAEGDIGVIGSQRSLVAGVVGWRAGMTVVWSSTWSGPPELEPALLFGEGSLPPGSTPPGKVRVVFSSLPYDAPAETFLLSAAIDGRVSAAVLRATVTSDIPISVVAGIDEPGTITWGPVGL